MQGQIRYAEALEALAMRHESADLLAMAAEAYMVPDAWAVDEVGQQCIWQLL